MKFVEIKRSLVRRCVWSYLRRNVIVYYAWIDGKKHQLNNETINDVHKILNCEQKDYRFYIEE